MPRFLAITATVATFAASMAAAAPFGPPTVFSATGADAAGIQGTVDAFRDALGPLNPPAPVAGDPGGRREINWDAAPDAVSDPNAFPGDFFNADVAPRARGIEFIPLAGAGNGGADGFQLSSTAASGEPVNFGRGSGFRTFSPERLFAPTGGTTFGLGFFLPEDQTSPGASRGLGIVFSDNDFDSIVPGLSNAFVSLFDINGGLLFEGFAETTLNRGLSFLGVLFDEPVISAAIITAGINPLDQPGGDNELTDLVAMDDFIFGEPVTSAIAPTTPVPLPAPALLLSAALGGLALLRRRTSVWLKC